VGVVVVDFGQSIKAVFSQQDVVAALLEENLRAAADGVAVVDDQHLQGMTPRAPVRAHSLLLP
jgi:hypothetical protein